MDHARLIELLGGFRAIARDLGLNPAVVWRWGRVRSIPARRWGWAIAEAQRRGIPGVTLETLQLADQIGGAERKRGREAKRRAAKRSAAAERRDDDTKAAA